MWNGIDIHTNKPNLTFLFKIVIMTHFNIGCMVTVYTYVLGIFGEVTGNRNAVQVTEEGYCR